MKHEQNTDAEKTLNRSEQRKQSQAKLGTNVEKLKMDNNGWMRMNKDLGAKEMRANGPWAGLIDQTDNHEQQ